MQRFDTKNPLDFAPFTVDFVNILPTGDKIIGGAVTTSLPTLTVAAVSFIGTQLTVWLAGGSEGTDYELTHAVDTAAGIHEVRPTLLLVSSDI